MWTQDFKIELFPLHSPLLGESLLVSFPPLNNMLKFSGSSHPNSDRITKKDDAFFMRNVSHPYYDLAALLQTLKTRISQRTQLRVFPEGTITLPFGS